MRWLYETWYRYGTPPWVTGPRQKLIELVETGRLQPGRAIDLGCGVGHNAIYLAQHGFDVTGIDYAPSAIQKAKAHAREARVKVRFEVDDLTDLQHDYGTFDLLVDYGTLDDLSPKKRDRYLQQIVPLARPEARFLLWCFEWEPTRGWRIIKRITPLHDPMLRPGEAQRRFSPHFHIEKIAGETGLKGFPRGWAAYLMHRNPAQAHPQPRRPLP